MKKQNKIILLPLLILISGCSYQGAMAPDESDPYEKTNRAIFEFNEDLDKAVLEPVADGYDVIIPEPIYKDFRAGDVKHSRADISKAQDLLNYRPTHFIREGILETVKWYMQEER